MTAPDDIRTDLPAGPHWEVASLEARFGAMLIDLVVILVVAFGAMLVLSIPGRALTLPDEQYTELLMGVSFALAAFGYRLGMEARAGQRNGQTLGKRATGIRIIRADGTPGITLPQAAARAALVAPFAAAGFALLPLLVTLWPASDPGDLVARAATFGLAIAGLTAAASTGRRAWYDHLCGTLVVRAQNVAASPAGHGQQPTAPQAYAAAPQPSIAPTPWYGAPAAAPPPCDAAQPSRFVPPPAPWSQPYAQPAPWGSQQHPASSMPQAPPPYGYAPVAPQPVAPAPWPTPGPPSTDPSARLPVRGAPRSWVAVVLLGALLVLLATSDELRPDPRVARSDPEQPVARR